ncbi:MAG: hypothetical protein J6P72_06500 [Firmicutes bacterium]|nr:hypothetical protein [Bacillota bacterium]
MTTVFLIDFENVNEAGLRAIQTTEDDLVVVIYTSNAKKIGLDSLTDIHASLRVIGVAPGKQSLDMHLVSYLGFVFHEKGKSAKYIIVSNDTDFDNVIEFWRSRKYDVSRMNVQMQTPAKPRSTRARTGTTRIKRTIKNAPAKEKPALAAANAETNPDTSVAADAGAKKPQTPADTGSKKLQVPAVQKSAELLVDVEKSPGPLMLSQAAIELLMPTKKTDAPAPEQKESLADKNAPEQKEGASAEKTEPFPEKQASENMDSQEREAGSLPNQEPAGAKSAGDNDKAPGLNETELKQAPVVSESSDANEKQAADAVQSPALTENTEKPAKTEKKKRGRRPKKAESENDQAKAEQPKQPAPSSQPKQPTPSSQPEKRSGAQVTELNNKLQSILSKEKVDQTVIAFTTSMVRKAMMEKNHKAIIYRAMIGQFGQKNGLTYYNLIKKEI